jgi:hypothetical protein
MGMRFGLCYTCKQTRLSVVIPLLLSRHMFLVPLAGISFTVGMELTSREVILRGFTVPLTTEHNRVHSLYLYTRMVLLSWRPCCASIIVSLPIRRT